MNDNYYDDDGKILNAHDAWMRVMDDVRAIHKDEQNKHQGFSFRGIDTAMNAIGPMFRKYGVSCVPSRIVEAKHRDFTSKNGTLQHEAIITVEYRVTGPDGSFFLGESIGESADSSDKATSQAMSVAYRTFLLQGLTMPTDSPDPDENTVDRHVPEPWAELGWEQAQAQADAWQALTERASALADSDDKTALKAWVKEQGYKATSLTKDGANEFHRRLKKIEDEAPFTYDSGDPVKDAGWKSKAERTRTYNSLMERISKLPALESDIITNVMNDLGITGDPDTFTRERAETLQAEIIEAEEQVKVSGS